MSSSKDEEGECEMNDEWETPPELFDKLQQEFHMNVDLCASENNHKLQFYTDDVEAFIRDYYDSKYKRYWMNPPYSRKNIDKCMQAAWILAQRGDTVVCLVRCDPSAKWFQNYVDGCATEVRMLKHRVKFVGAPSAYNFPCCVVVYEENVEGKTEYKLWSWKDDK